MLWRDIAGEFYTADRIEERIRILAQMAYLAWQMVQDIYFLSGFHVEAYEEMEPLCKEAYE